MIKIYLRLVTFFAIQHQVLAGDRSVEPEEELQVLGRQESNIPKSEILLAPQNADGISKVKVKFDKNEKVMKPSGPTRITPIVNHERHRHHHHYRKHQSEKKNIPHTEDHTESVKIPAVTQNTPFQNLDKEKTTPASPFHRRNNNYLDEAERNKPQKWAHCLDLITPRLKGYKDDWKVIQHNSTYSDVLRVSQLLSVDVSNYTQEEIESILFQISNIRLRLFRWDYTAITHIFNILIPGPVHNFKTLKAGIRFLFDRWHLDTSMMSTFLKQTRIFRPPCIETSGLEGSTLKASGKRVTVPEKKTSVPSAGDYSPSCESEDMNDNAEAPPS